MQRLELAASTHQRYLLLVCFELAPTVAAALFSLPAMAEWIAMKESLLS